MDRPNIHTAIPKRRYVLGEFTVVVLADITSEDDVEYRYILAVIRAGESEPGLYLTVERPLGSQLKGSRYNTRLIMQDGSDEIDMADSWMDVDSFAAQALKIVQTILDLQDEEPRRIL